MKIKPFPTFLAFCRKGEKRKISAICAAARHVRETTVCRKNSRKKNRLSSLSVPDTALPLRKKKMQGEHMSWFSHFFCRPPFSFPLTRTCRRKKDGKGPWKRIVSANSPIPPKKLLQKPKQFHKIIEKYFFNKCRQKKISHLSKL